MTLEQRQHIDAILRGAPFDLGGDVTVQRPLLDQMLTAQPLPPDVRTSSGELGGVPVTFVDIEGIEARGTLVHLHGGGFALGSALGSVGLASDLARRAGMRAVAVDYRLAPEHPYPAALRDVTSAYLALRDETDLPVVVSGESAGGNLALELLIANRDEQFTMPAAVVLMSPMTDLTMSGASYTAKAEVDPNITAEAVRTRIRDYLDGTDTSEKDPLASPVLADLRGLPPMLIQAGSHEVLLDDATALATTAAAHDVPVLLDVTPGVPHVFQAFSAILEEADAALSRAAQFITEHLA